MTENQTENQQVKCMDCGYEFVPSMMFDFYSDDTDPTKGRCERCFMSKAFGKPALSGPIPIPEGYEETVCKAGQGETACSFLGYGEGAMRCLKGSDMAEIIIERKAEGSIRAKGDNCSGPPNFTVKVAN